MYLNMDNLDDDIADPETYALNRTNGSRVTRTFTIMTPGTYTFSVVFHLGAVAHVRNNVARIYRMAFKGVDAGSAPVCEPCMLGFGSEPGSQQCSPCPVGTYAPTIGSGCKPVPEGFFTDVPGASTPIACGSGTTSKPDGTGCLTDCLYHAMAQFEPLPGKPEGDAPSSEAGTPRTWDLNPLYNPELMYFAGTDSIGHQYFLNVCGTKHSSVVCYDASGIPIPTFACQHVFDGKYSVDLGRVIGFQPLDPAMVDLARRTRPNEPWPANPLGLTLIFTEGTLGCAASHGGRAIPRRTDVTMVCDPDAGIGMPVPIAGGDTAELEPRSCRYSFVWRSTHACPVCVDEDFELVRGECVDGIRNISAKRVRPCAGAVSIPPILEPCFLCPVDGEGRMCGGHGVCDEQTGTCACAANWSGETCESCDAGVFGPECSQFCPGGVDNVCSGHGSCSSGRTGTGICSCSVGWTGDQCNSCAEGFEGDTCEPIPATIRDVVPWWAFLVGFLGLMLLALLLGLVWYQKRRAEHKYSLLLGSQPLEMDVGFAGSKDGHLALGEEFHLPEDDDEDILGVGAGI